MNILVIPTTDWTRHPVPNRLNFIFDILAKHNNVHIFNFELKKFKDQPSRSTQCQLHNATVFDSVDPSLYYFYNALPQLFKLKKIVREQNIDVIVSSNILPSFIVNFVKRNIPVVVDYLDHFEESASVYYPESFVGKIVQKGVSFLVRSNLKRANSVITVTREFESFLRSVGVKEVFVIPNGVDTSAFKVIPTSDAKKDLGLGDKPVIGYVGSLEYWVDLETVVEALPELDVTLMVVGPGLFTDYSDKIKEMARSLKVEDKIVFTGRVDYSQLYRYICAMDIGLNPLKSVQKNEITVGGKVFNYMACGKPVLSSRMKALESLLGNDLFYYDDVLSFRNCVNNLLNSTIESEKYISVASKFDWASIAEKYESFLRKQVE
ncbi:MAG: group 1 glycosyl transferase [Methanohalophilus sp.]|nr:MAG: group 1 glycosyl transferase [Methanohalophilus sp.]